MTAAPLTAAELAAILAIAANPGKTYRQSLQVYAALPRLVAELTRAREVRVAAQAVVNSYGAGDWEIRGGTRKLIAALAAALGEEPAQS